MPVILMRYLPYILPLLIIGYAGWDFRGRYDAKIISDIRIAQAEAQAKAETKTLTIERKWAEQLNAAEVKSAKTLDDMRTRYDAARLRAQNSRVVVSSAPACATTSDEASSSDGLSESVARAEIEEIEVIDKVLEPADTQTQSLMACQSYINIIHNKQP